MTLFENKNIDWDLIGIFCLVARENGIRKAARHSGISVQTISRRITLLEEKLGAKVFIREPQGVSLTKTGQQIYDDAVAAETHISNIARIGRRNLNSNSGLVSVNISEGVGTFWLTPRLNRYRKKCPNVVLDYKTSSQLVEVNPQETDIVVQLSRPTDNNLICRKLGYLHLGLYCSRDYEQYKPLPQKFDEFNEHTFVYQSSDQIDHIALLDFIGSTDFSEVIKYSVNSSLSLYQLIRTSFVIGILPTYASAIADHLMYIPSSPSGFKVELWLGYHEDVRDYPSARHFVDWLIESFDEKMFPWFGEDFVSPKKIVELDRSSWRENISTFVA